MANSHTPVTGESFYKAALERMTPEMREAFIDACLASGIREEDVIHALILCQAKILDAGLNAHAQEVTAAVQGELNGILQRIDQARKEGQAAREKLLQEQAANLEEIRRRQAQLAKRE